MEHFTCKMCGSTDIDVQEAFFACRACGIKYSVDDAYDAGSLYAMAEGAYASDKKREAESYCDKITGVDPCHFRAWLLKGRSVGEQSTPERIRIEEAVGCFERALDTATEDALGDVGAEVARCIKSLAIGIIDVCCVRYGECPERSNAQLILNALVILRRYMPALLERCGASAEDVNKKISGRIGDAVREAWINKIWAEYSEQTFPSKVSWECFREKGFSAVKLLQVAADLYNGDADKTVRHYKNMIHIRQALIDSCGWTYINGKHVPEIMLADDAKNINIDMIMEYHKRIKDIDPSYAIPERPRAKKNGGCYIATCVYGSYDCPQVWVLRRYRDDTLGATWYGRAFIRTYYAVSPTLVKWFGGTAWFRRMWRGILDRMVYGLSSRGVEDTPYEDR